MKHPAAWLIAMMLSAAVACAPAARGAEKGDDDDAPAPGRVTTYEGRQAVRLGLDVQAQSGIELAVAEPSEWRPEINVQGKVMDIQPLLQLRAQYNQTVAERDAAQASLHSTDTALQRLAKLHEGGAGVSERQLQEARSQREADFARFKAAEAGMRDARDQALQNWGEALTGWAFDPGSEALDPFLHRAEVLLFVAFSPEQGLVPGTTTIMVGRGSDRTQAVPATLVSNAPYTYGAMGETYFFRAPAGEFRIGMRAYAWAPGTGSVEGGVFVPDTAVVWFAGHPWLYLRHDREWFIRHAISGQTVIGDRWFIPGRSLAGSEIVKAGGQMLLSEESRAGIPDEDNDP